MKNFAYNKQSSYKRYFKILTLLSFLPKNATLEIKARWDGLLLQGKSTVGCRGKPFPFQLHHFSFRNELSETGTDNTAMTFACKGKKFRNNYRVYLANNLNLLKAC